MIKKFVLGTAQLNTSKNYGAINHTLVMASEGIPPKVKKMKQEKNTTVFDSG